MSSMMMIVYHNTHIWVLNVQTWIPFVVFRGGQSALSSCLVGDSSTKTYTQLEIELTSPPQKKKRSSIARSLMLSLS